MINGNKTALLVSDSISKEVEGLHSILQVKSSTNCKINNSSRIHKRAKDTGQTTVPKIQGR